ncbi:oligogalacturonate-specific porin KdgM family protein [Agarivorans litoreus]|uniref:oligogalacturonate-specific porin KdgM family protein n=1 Tax=Agarivorans litoreus TaxID=1510455 RepID=UPI001C7C9EB3|nr:oligogalacturonate-specific porin KdgM family protein [Agarivorans litoreus]
MKIKQIALITTLLLSAGSVSAASLDFRQEYKHDTEKYASRIKLGAGVGNYYFGVEAMQHGHIFSDWESKGNEFDFGYKYKIDEKWMLIPGMPITFFPGHVTFKPQLRVQYKFDSGLTAKLRYRHEFRRFTDEKDKSGEQKSKITANLNYNYNYFQFGLEGNFEKGLDDQVLFDNDDTNWDLLFQIGYKGKDWNLRPYAEFGNVSVSSKSSDRQLRSRVGITYSF